MQSILVLTDFSGNAFLAAEYAGMLSRKWKSRRILLLHVRQAIPAVAHTPVVAAGRGDLYREDIRMMEASQRSLRKLADPDTQVDFAMEDGELVKQVNLICEKENTDLVVMGITGKTGLEKVLIGSNSIRVMESCDYPLLLVPPNAALSYPQTVVLATDLKEVEEKMKVPLLDELLPVLSARLLVCNVAVKEGHAVELKKEITALHTLLDAYHPEFHYINHPDIAEGIHEFVSSRKAELLITLHRQRTWLAALFHKSISKKLAWHSRIPVLVLPVSA